MTSYEYSGKTVKDAVMNASRELGVDEALLEIEVLQESARGFLGIVGQREARVRVRKRNVLKEALETPPPESAAVSGQEDRAPDLTCEKTDTYEPAESDHAPVERRAGNEPAGSDIEAAAETLRNILARMEMETEIKVDVVDNGVRLDVQGDGSGLLIGKKGQTLDALQYLVSKIVNKDKPQGAKVEIEVDTENYRSRRLEKFREMALRIGVKAKRTLKPVHMEPMQAGERRIIHMILAEDRDVYTKSFGEGPMRRIMVFPRRGAVNKRRRR